MSHLVLAFYLVAALAGAFSISQALMTWQRYRKTVIRRYAFFLVSLLLVLLGFLVDLYSQIAGLSAEAVARALVWILQAAGGTLYIVICPYLFHSLAGRAMPLWQRWLFLALDAAVVMAALANLAFPGVAAIPLALAGVLFSMILYGLVYVAVRLPGVGGPTLRRALLIFLCLSAVFFPLMAADALMSGTGILASLRPLNNLAQPLYFLALTALTIVFGARYLNRPAYREQGRLTDYFLSAFGVTPREAQIIAQLMDGASMYRIGRNLFISPKTAENHVYSIYRKLGVRNRLQMFQVLTTNSIE
jgi:DNA-binding CsgD family transcriptional regulator